MRGPARVLPDGARAGPKAAARRPGPAGAGVGGGWGGGGRRVDARFIPGAGGRPPPIHRATPTPPLPPPGGFGSLHRRVRRRGPAVACH
jgi:hypothetical protein